MNDEVYNQMLKTAGSDSWLKFKAKYLGMAQKPPTPGSIPATGSDKVINSTRKTRLGYTQEDSPPKVNYSKSKAKPKKPDFLSKMQGSSLKPLRGL